MSAFLFVFLTIFFLLNASALVAMIYLWLQAIDLLRFHVRVRNELLEQRTIL